MDLKMLTNVTQIIYMQSLADATIVQRWNGAENVFEISEQFIEHRVLLAGGLSTESIVEVDWTVDSVLYKA